MRLNTSVVLAVMAVVTAAQGAPQRPFQSSRVPERFRNLIGDMMDDMSGIYSRMRTGFTRTFANDRPAFRTNNLRTAPAIDPAIHTNEITPSRASSSDDRAPNAPHRRPLPRQNISIMQRMEQFMGGVRNMFQNFNRGGPSRRAHQPPPQFARQPGGSPAQSSPVQGQPGPGNTNTVRHQRGPSNQPTSSKLNGDRSQSFRV